MRALLRRKWAGGARTGADVARQADSRFTAKPAPRSPSTITSISAGSRLRLARSSMTARRRRGASARWWRPPRAPPPCDRAGARAIASHHRDQDDARQLDPLGLGQGLLVPVVDVAIEEDRDAVLVGQVGVAREGLLDHRQAALPAAGQAQPEAELGHHLQIVRIEREPPFSGLEAARAGRARTSRQAAARGRRAPIAAPASTAFCASCRARATGSPGEAGMPSGKRCASM